MHQGDCDCISSCSPGLIISLNWLQVALCVRESLHLYSTYFGLTFLAHTCPLGSTDSRGYKGEVCNVCDGLTVVLTSLQHVITLY